MLCLEPWHFPWAHNTPQYKSTNGLRPFLSWKTQSTYTQPISVLYKDSARTGLLHHSWGCFFLHFQNCFQYFPSSRIFQKQYGKCRKQLPFLGNFPNALFHFSDVQIFQTWGLCCIIQGGVFFFPHFPYYFRNGHFGNKYGECRKQFPTDV